MIVNTLQTVNSSRSKQCLYIKYKAVLQHATTQIFSAVNCSHSYLQKNLFIDSLCSLLSCRQISPHLITFSIVIIDDCTCSSASLTCNSIPRTASD